MSCTVDQMEGVVRKLLRWAPYLHGIIGPADQFITYTFSPYKCANESVNGKPPNHTNRQG